MANCHLLPCDLVEQPHLSHVSFPIDGLKVWGWTLFGSKPCLGFWSGPFWPCLQRYPAGHSLILGVFASSDQIWWSESALEMYVAHFCHCLVERLNNQKQNELSSPRGKFARRAIAPTHNYRIVGLKDLSSKSLPSLQEARGNAVTYLIAARSMTVLFGSSCIL